MSSPRSRELMPRIRELAYNLWWTWSPAARELFEALSPALWRATRRSAVTMLHGMSDSELAAILADPAIAMRAERALAELDAHMLRPAAAVGGRELGGPVAFFSPEFALHQSLPIYSGGLGVLAGDFVKAAADLAIPLVGVGLLYRQGYMTQRIADHRQKELYPEVVPERAPITRVRDAGHKPIEFEVEIGQHRVRLGAWLAQVGRSRVYLLDAQASDDPELRAITSRAYGGGPETRIAQEIILGIGGVRLLAALGIRPALFHLNEGHSAFLVLELLRQGLAAGRKRDEVVSAIRRQCLFTTHTPVEAGHDRFASELVAEKLSGTLRDLGMSLDELIELGRDSHEKRLCMTVLGLRFAGVVNAVSELHGEVTREMWKSIPREPDQAPITHVTNGVHTATWTAPRAHVFWRGRLGPDWIARTRAADFPHRLAEIPDEELWALRVELRRSLVQLVRRRARRGRRTSDLDLAHAKPADVLTLGFARRFAAYKRAALLFSDLARLERIVSNPERPVQIIFAGKAHPADRDGKRLVHHVAEWTHRPELRGRVILLEDYDMDLGRYLVSGSDVWLNTPMRRHEASGTSGQKTAIHGTLHASTPDGWWREGYAGDNGWRIGRDTGGRADEIADAEDAGALYALLESEIVPMFYQRDDLGIPRAWVARMRRAMITLVPRFGADRMVYDYAGLYARLLA